MKAFSIAETIAAEAGGRTLKERYRDMLAIASAIANRMSLTGETAESIVSAPRQFDAYGRRMPAGTSKLTGLAEKAWREIQAKGPIHQGAYYATPGAVGNLPSGLTRVDASTAHQYFSDPRNRAIATASGYRRPGGLGVSLPDVAPTPTASPGGLGAANYAAPVSVDIARSAVPSQSVSRSQQTWERIAPTTPEMMQSAGLLSNPGFRPDITAPQGLGAAQMAGGLGAPSPERFARTTTETLPSGGTLAFRPDIGPSQAEIGDIAAAYAASSPSVAKSKAAFDAMRPGPNNAQPGQFDNMLAGMAGLGAPATAVSASPADIAGIGTALDTTRGVIGGLGLEPGGTIYSLADAVNSPTIAAPDQYPPAPADDQPSSLSKAMKRAAIGGLLGGLPGAALGLASGMFGNELGGLGIDSFGDAKYGPAGDAERFSVGSGVRGVEAAMSGARGATARASNGSTITSRGRGLGYDLTNQFGARTTYDANGKAIGNRNTLDRLGGLFGGLFGGGFDRTKGEFSKAERDKYSGGKGLF